MSSKPRDYRDDADVDDALDALRACPDREQAKTFYRACLDCAYQQGRVDRMGETIDEMLRRKGDADDQAGSV